MLIQTSEAKATAVLGAMRQIALAHGPGGVSDADRVTIETAGSIVFALGEVDVDSIDPVSPEQLADVHEDDPKLAVRMLAVMSLVDGRNDPEKNALVNEYASALEVDEDYLAILTEAAEGEVAQAAACIVRKNAESFPHLDSSLLDISAVAPFFPYRDGNEDPGKADRYRALGELADGTFGRAFYDHFHENGFAFPGEENGLAEGFTTPHDSSHVLSGYSTNELGELCVSTFIGGMHPDHPISAEVLPVLFSWHLGIKLNDIANSATGWFDPPRFWTGWDRGAGTTTDIVAAGWDFWGATEVPLEELRRRYNVAPADPEMLA